MRQLVIFLFLVTIACSKEEAPPSVSFVKPSAEIKETDTTFNTLNELSQYSTFYNSVPEFLTNTKWNTSFDKTYTLTPSGDTVYQRSNIIGKLWSFSFGPSSNTGMLVKSSNTGNTSHAVEVQSFYLLLDEIYQNEISEITLYKDRTFSFSLKSVIAIDTLQRVSTVKLQSLK